jgi:hypothetical protein
MIDAFARGLHAFISCASACIGVVDLPVWPALGLPDDRLWPTPHDLRFDFSAPGGEWIDAIARRAREQLSHATGRQAITHSDWRAENLRFQGERLVAIYDWDSTVLSKEPCAVGSPAHAFATNWANPATHHLPTPEQARAFGRA